ncbi:hypothetical protein [Aliarcobacter lanthieri]|uniref:hypothetical protein n=1 Tax=Aliarcobacter lanthieri TaxID=1355374 RepID=UPI003AABFC95
MSKLCIKEFLNKEYFIYIIFRFLSIVTMVLAVFFILNLEFMGNIYFVISLFVLSFFFIVVTNRLKTPKLAKCLDKTPINISFFVGLFIYLGLGLLVISVVTGFKDMNIVYFNIALFIFGTILYFYNCKKNKIFEKEDRDV